MATKTIKAKTEELRAEDMEKEVLAFFNQAPERHLLPGEIKYGLSARQGVTCKTMELSDALASLHRKELVGMYFIEMPMKQGTTVDAINVWFYLEWKGLIANNDPDLCHGLPGRD